MSETKRTPIRGRGAASNPLNRFEQIEVEVDPEAEIEGRPPTLYLRDGSRTVIAYNSSPDVGFSASLNPYRGCEHGCSYCYARPFHEYLGFSAGLDFETRIMVKEEAPELLRRELSSPRFEPQNLALSGVTDAYQPIERKLEITRRCLQVLAEFRNPVIVITKNALVCRDADLLAELAAHDAAAVSLSVTSLEVDLARRLEPRAAHPERRLKAIETLNRAGVPTGVSIAPVIPGLNDHEIPRILEAASEAGAAFATFVLLRLPHGVADLFSEWLEHHEPGRRSKILNKVKEMRGGKLYDSTFGQRMRGHGRLAEQIRQLFELSCRRHQIPRRPPELSTAAFQRPGEQLRLF